MMVPILLLIIALIFLLWQSVLDPAMHVLKERAGMPHSQDGPRITKGVTVAILIAVVAFMASPREWFEPPPPMLASYGADSLWMGMDSALIDNFDGEREDLVRYGRELIRNTSYYLGPKGSVAQLTNGMDCENCHLAAGTLPWGNNYGAVWSTYPKFRARSGGNETVAKRVNDCVERSLNGTALDTTGKEMQAILAYMEWLGTGIVKGAKPKGSGLVELKFLDVAADPVHGEAIYTAKCASCHHKDGAGVKSANGITFQYPPLWGEHSYNIGAGLYRLSRFAGYVKANMPQGATWEDPLLTDEEAWDVAAYINSRQRPARDLSKDWPKIAVKPVDHPFGPYADSFPEIQHKFGPFRPIAEVKKNAKP